LEQLAQNDLYLIQLGDTVNQLLKDVAELKGPGPKKLNGKPAQYYIDNSVSIGEVPPKNTPVVEVILTADMTPSGSFYTATAKLRKSKGNGVYAATGDNFDIWDINANWWYLIEDDTAFISWDAQQNVWRIVYSDVTQHLEGVLGADLSSGGSASVTDHSTGTVRTAYGYMVPTGKKLASGTRVKYNACMLRKKWVVYSSQDCAVTA
jgi:hypothetical protein